MAEITAINNTGSQSIIGRIAKIDTRLINGYVYTRLVDTLPLGVVANTSPHKSPSRIVTTGVAHVSVIGRVKRNDPIRLAKTGDVGVSQGQCVVAKSGDAPYLKVGTAQSSGTGLIPVSLEWAWVSAGTEGDELLKVDQTTPQTTLGTLTFPQSKFGTPTSYTHFEADGTMRKVGAATTFDDLPPTPIIGAKLGATAPTLATFISDVEQYTFDATNDYVIGATELIHGWKEGTTIYPHIHWATNGSEGTAKGVKWQLKYTIADYMGNFSAQATLTVDIPIPAGTADRKHFISGFTPTIAGTNYHIGTYILWRLERVATAEAGGEPAADPFALALGIHVECDTTGSRALFTK